MFVHDNVTTHNRENVWKFCSNLLTFNALPQRFSAKHWPFIMYFEIIMYILRFPYMPLVLSCLLHSSFLKLSQNSTNNCVLHGRSHFCLLLRRWANHRIHYRHVSLKCPRWQILIGCNGHMRQILLFNWTITPTGPQKDTSIKRKTHSRYIFTDLSEKTS